jgi:hypothetical protein
VQIRSDKNYFINFLMIEQDIVYVYLLRNKNKVLEMFKHFKNKIKNQLSMKIKMIKKRLRMMLNTRTKHWMECWCYVNRFKITLKFVGMDILSTNYILNKTPYKKLGKISYELLNSQSPSYKYLKCGGV